MLSLVDLSDWKTKHEIQAELEEKNIFIDERSLRKYVENHNYRFVEGQVDTFIAHSSKGYKVTKEASEIIASINDYKKRAFDQLRKVSRYTKTLGLMDNLKLELNEVLENGRSEVD